MKPVLIARVAPWLAVAAILSFWPASWSQDKGKVKEKDQDKDTSPMRGSLVEDRAARKLLEAGDARLEAGEPGKAVEVWQSVIERYPRSKVRYEAHMRL